MSQRRSTSSNTSGEAGGVVQPAMFVYRVDEVAKRLALGDQPKWQYPCGLCNGQLVTEPGALCSACAQDTPRSRRRPAKRTRKTTAKKPAKTATGKRTPPWERVASDGPDEGASR